MADDKSVAEKAADKVPGSEYMPLSHPPETELEHAEREPDKVIPHPDSDGADTPSGAALREVGAPDPEKPGTEKERQRGLKYRAEKYKKRWLS